MFFKSKIFRAACVLTLAFSLVAITLADTIRLKDGSIIKGKIVNFSGGRFTVLINDGTRRRQMNFNAVDVESILFDATASPVKSSNETALENNSDMQNAPVTNRVPAESQTTSQTRTNSPGAPVLQNNSPAVAATPASSLPITLNVKVLSDNTSNGWTNSDFVVKKGQRIRISSTGRVSLGSGRYTTPDGIISLPDPDKLMPSQPTGGLIAVVGDDNNDFIFIGSAREFTATRDGALFLGVNEGNLNDNSGVFEVKIQIFPNK